MTWDEPVFSTRLGNINYIVIARKKLAFLGARIGYTDTGFVKREGGANVKFSN